MTIKAHGMENKPPSLINQPRQKPSFSEVYSYDMHVDR